MANDMVKKTLAERISGDISEVNIKKAAVKIPELKLRRQKLRLRKQKFFKAEKDDKIPISSIINILIKAAVEKAKKDRKDKAALEEERIYSILKEEMPGIAGGYGTKSKVYGSAARTSYIDYGKLFGYLGKFRSQTPYEDLDHGAIINKSLDDGNKFLLVEKEIMDKGSAYVKYLKPQVVNLDTSSLVPLAGMDSSEWEQFKLWMKLDPVMYRLKTSIA